MAADNSPSDHPRSNDLRELKRQLRSKYLGRFGIHALGAKTAEDAICVYLRPGAEDQEVALSALRNEVAPHKLMIVEEEPPRLA